MFAFDRYRLRNFNLPVLLVMIALSILGFTVLQSAVAHDADGFSVPFCSCLIV